MLAKLQTFSMLGIEALPVEVEVDVSPGALPKTVLVGLPEAAVRQSTHRVERALVNSGFMCPQDRVVDRVASAARDRDCRPKHVTIGRNPASKESMRVSGFTSLGPCGHPVVGGCPRVFYFPQKCRANS